MNIQQQYSELLTLTKAYLLQEFPRDGWISTDLANYSTFKHHAPPLNNTNQQISSPKNAPVSLPPKTAVQIERITIPSSITVHTEAQQTPLIKPVPRQPAKPVSKEKVIKSQPEKQVAQQSSPHISLEPIGPPASVDFSELRKILTDRVPALQIIDTIPNDDEAKLINNTWQNPVVIPTVVILSYQETPQEQALLQNLAKAIQTKLAPATIISAQKIDKENGWEALLQSKELRLIITSTHGLNAFPSAMKHYREAPKLAKSYLGKVSLCLLSDLSIYLKEPKLKPALWQAICDHLAN